MSNDDLINEMRGADEKFTGKWPLTGEIGIQVYAIAGSAVAFPGSYVKADDLERLLEKGVRVRSWGERIAWYVEDSQDFDIIRPTDQASRDAILINIQPIKPADTAISLLREWVYWHENRSIHNSYMPIIDRARKLLSKADE